MTINETALTEAYQKGRTEALEEGIPEEEVDQVVCERLQEEVSRHIAQFIERKHWLRHDAVNKAHFE